MKEAVEHQQMSVTGAGKLHPVGGIQPVAYFIVKTMRFRRRRERRKERGT